MLLSLQYTTDSTPDAVLAAFIDAGLPSLFESNTLLFNDVTMLQNLVVPVTSLCLSIKATLLVAASILPGVSILVDSLIDGLQYQQGRPTKASKPIANAPIRKKRRRTDEGLNAVQRAVLEALTACLGSDEQLKVRWSRFSELV